VNTYGISLLYENEVIQNPAEQTGISVVTKRLVCPSVRSGSLSVSNGVCSAPSLQQDQVGEPKNCK
jgi:hypothetical protein